MIKTVNVRTNLQELNLFDLFYYKVIVVLSLLTTILFYNNKMIKYSIKYLVVNEYHYSELSYTKKKIESAHEENAKLQFFNTQQKDISDKSSNNQFANKKQIVTKVQLKVKTYIVQSNDNLWKISKNHNISLSTLIGYNNLYYNQVLHKGQKLLIPNYDGIKYKIRRGQTLWDISKTYHVSISDIIEFNNLPKTGRIMVGQKLFIPGAKPLKYRYTVSSRSKFLKPVKGYISSQYGYRMRPITNRREFHTGIDIAARRKTPVRCAFYGRIAFTGWIRGYGRCIKVKHPHRYDTFYAHLNKILVRKNQYIERGQVIGLVGNTGFSTGPHLHFEIRKNGRTINPIRMIR